MLNADGVGIGPSPGLFAEDRQRSELGRGDVRQRRSTTIRPRIPQVEDRHPARPEPGSRDEHDKDDLPACHCTHRSREGSSRGINTIKMTSVPPPSTDRAAKPAQVRTCPWVNSRTVARPTTTPASKKPYTDEQEADGPHHPRPRRYGHEDLVLAAERCLSQDSAGSRESARRVTDIFRPDHAR